MVDPQMKRKFVLVKLDETLNWEHGDPAILAKAGRIFGLYVADLSVGVHCCELTRSYALYFVESQWEGTGKELSEEDREAVHDYVMEGDRDTQPVSYMHCHTVDAFPVLDSKKGEFFPPKGKTGAVIELGEVEQDEDEVSDEDALEGMMEYVRTNGF
jgi:hypothetical protein